MTQTIFEAYNGCKNKLESAGIEDYVFESKQIIKHVTGYTNIQILNKFAERLTEFQQKSLDSIIEKRVMRYPLQYIFGEWEFYGRKFLVGNGVLIPRADTETVIDECLELLKDNETPDILDLCSGSGCIGITLALEKKKSRVDLVEKYCEAVNYIEKNIKLNNAHNANVFSGDIYEGIMSDKSYDVIVSNPPYISADDMAALSEEVKYEPDTALYGGEDGLMFYRAITDIYKNCLKTNGKIVFEVGIGQAHSVALILKEQKFSDIGIKKDLNGIERVVFGTVNKI
ncbi:MAG: peptide chain release factor N(5)-glutamine methyltransferase [Clostridia bacterium]|nr:peptide chain release factor N(5)-glutamine methyltransferase [Clostridia bacterium]